MSNNNTLKKPATRGWPPERRKKQAARLRAAKIWTRSTGPKTRQGKARAAQNSRKHGFYARGYQALRKALRAYRAFLKLVNALVETLRQSPHQTVREVLTSPPPSLLTPPLTHFIKGRYLYEKGL